jgi:hypothetical protein
MASNDIGSQTGTRGTSMALNNQKNLGGVKPSPKGGKDNPGDTKPPMDSMDMKAPLSGCK